MTVGKGDDSGDVMPASDPRSSRHARRDRASKILAIFVKYLNRNYGNSEIDS